MGDQMLRNSGVVIKKEQDNSGLSLNSSAFHGWRGVKNGRIDEQKTNTGSKQPAINYHNPTTTSVYTRGVIKEEQDDGSSYHNKKLISPSSPAVYSFESEIEHFIKKSRFNEQAVNFNNSTTPFFERHVELSLKCGEMETGEQYHANNGSHNQTMNYDKPLTPNFTRSTGNQTYMPGTRRYQLKFLKNVCQPVCTGVPIKGEDGNSLMVALIDGQSGQVSTFRSEVSIRVEIVVLEADFGGKPAETLTRDMFKSKIVTKEENNRLLTGTVVVVLKEGFGCVSVAFTHTKRWRMKCAYRLGAIVTDANFGTQIREGFTDPFEVKDRRLCLNTKHYPPTLADKVWRLIGIAKDGPFNRRLSEININTVEGFLKKLDTDPEKLRDVFGKAMSSIKWEALVAHARTCIVDDSQKFQRENLIGSEMNIFPINNDFTQPVLPFTSKESPVVDRSQGSMILSSGSRDLPFNNQKQQETETMSQQFSTVEFKKYI